MGTQQPRYHVHRSELLVKWVLMKKDTKLVCEVVLIKYAKFYKNEVTQYGKTILYYRGRTGEVPQSD